MSRYIIVLPVFLIGILTGKVLFGGSGDGSNADSARIDALAAREMRSGKSNDDDSSASTASNKPVSKNESPKMSGDFQEPGRENARSASELPPSQENGLTREACFDILVPSDLPEFHMAMARRVDQYLSTNEEIWTAGSSESAQPLDFSTLEKSLGRYEYDFQVDSSVIYGNGKFDLQVVPHTGKVSGNIESKSFRRDGNGEPQIANGVSGPIGESNFGTNPGRLETHLVWISPGGGFGLPPDDPVRKVVRYGIKFPSGMTPGSTKTLDLYGLHETLKWNRVGRIHLKRLPDSSLN